MSYRSVIAVTIVALLGVACGGDDSPTTPTPTPTPQPTTSSVQNLTNIEIPDTNTSGPADPHPSTIGVSGMSGTITDVNVTIVALSHTYPDDLDVLLAGPQGQAVLLMSDTGGNADVANVTLTFDQSASESLPDSSTISSGTYVPTNFSDGDTFDDPAPDPPYNLTFEVFNGTNPNGTWSLYIDDDAGADTGDAGGWSIEITTLASTSSVPSVSTFTGPLGGTVTAASATDSDEK